MNNDILFNPNIEDSSPVGYYEDGHSNIKGFYNYNLRLGNKEEKVKINFVIQDMKNFEGMDFFIYTIHEDILESVIRKIEKL